VAVEVVVGFLGCGVVGSAALRLLRDHRADIERRSGCRFEVSRILVRDAHRSRDVPVSPELFTTESRDVLAGQDVAVVVELMGGIEPARTLVLEAFRAGKHVVTANKELLANHGRELFEEAEANGVNLSFEAAVAGGIPLIHPLTRALAGERLTRVLGIVNGTTNYVLSRMTDDGMSFGEALAEAERLGFAERDPSDDIEGFDAAAKCAILATVAFDTPVVAGDVYREGISRVSAEDVEFADRLGYVVKLLAVAELEEGDLAVRVHPAMIPRHHPLASVRDSYNAVFVEGPKVGQLMFYGRGAGGDPTATAVVGDLVEVGRSLKDGRTGVMLASRFSEERRIRAMEAMESQYYLLLDVIDRPGVLAQIAGAFGQNKVSIKSVWQEGFGDDALLVMITHRANEGALQQTARDLRALEPVLEVRSVMRVEGAE
jgi:homoserine dehydrogenase